MERAQEFELERWAENLMERGYEMPEKYLNAYVAN